MARKLIFFKLTGVLVVALGLGACTRKTSQDSKISLRLPDAVGGLSIAQNVSLSRPSGNWPIPPRARRSTVTRWRWRGPALTGAAVLTSRTDIAKPGMIAGAYPAGTQLELNVPSGAERKIYLLGFQTDSLTHCKNFDSAATGLDPSHFSAPFVLDSVTRRLDPGSTVQISMTVPAVLPAAAKFEECAPKAFYRPGGAESPLTLTSVTPTSGSSFGATAVSVVGSGFTAATSLWRDGLRDSRDHADFDHLRDARAHGWFGGRRRDEGHFAGNSDGRVHLYRASRKPRSHRNFTVFHGHGRQRRHGQPQLRYHQ